MLIYSTLPVSLKCTNVTQRICHSVLGIRPMTFIHQSASLTNGCILGYFQLSLVIISLLQPRADQHWLTGRHKQLALELFPPLISAVAYVFFPHQSTAVSCGNPGTPAHGRIVFSDGITFGSSVAYACWEGFKTSGLTTRHCTTNGTWTGQPPDCTGRKNFTWLQSI